MFLMQNILGSTFEYFETSAKTGENVEKVHTNIWEFTTCGKNLLSYFSLLLISLLPHSPSLILFLPPLSSLSLPYQMFNKIGQLVAYHNGLYIPTRVGMTIAKRMGLVASKSSSISHKLGDEEEKSIVLSNEPNYKEESSCLCKKT